MARVRRRIPAPPPERSFGSRLLTAAAWSTAVMVIFGALQAYGIRRQGLGWPAVWSEAPYWLWLWPPFFFMILVFPLLPKLFTASRSFGENLAGGRNEDEE